jgi:serine/threonine protein kinase
MGEVYLAVDQRLGSAVALKRTFFSDHDTLGNAFEREARILGRLRHPVLPKVSDHFVENENQYLVMEHINGDDLAKRLELTQKPFPLSWVLFWSDQLLDALSYLHSHEPPVIHRDIKPQNLKLTDENNIILLDFGLSKTSIGDSRLSSPISSQTSGSVVGYTPHYAPMEQIRGTGTSPRSDIYSLSATIYQLLTNTVPPDALSRADSLLNGQPDPVKPINEINAEVSKGVSDVIIKGMAVSQDLRYTNSREMQKELREAYSQLQKAMAAQTVAFSAQEPIVSAVSEKTEPLIANSPINETPQNAVVSSNAPTEVPSFETPSVSSPSQAEQSDFDATLFYDGEPKQFPEKQSDIKTEVFSGGISIPEVEKPAPAENFSPEATIPLISHNTQTAEQTPSEVDFNLTESKSGDEMAATIYAPEAETGADNFIQNESSAVSEDFSFSQDYGAVETQYTGEQYEQENYNSKPQENYDSQPQQAAVAAAGASAIPVAAQPQTKSGGGKMLAIFGVLGLLLFLGIGAAGFGYWYFYGGSGGTDSTTTEKDATPTPTETVSPTPSPEEILVDNNSNTNTESNNSTEIANTDTNTNTNTNINTETTRTTTTKTTPTPLVTTKTPVTQTTRVNPTPKKTQVSTAGTPKPVQTPRRDDPTKILQ